MKKSLLGQREFASTLPQRTRPGPAPAHAEVYPVGLRSYLSIFGDHLAWVRHELRRAVVELAAQVRDNRHDPTYWQGLAAQVVQPDDTVIVGHGWTRRAALRDLARQLDDGHKGRL